MDEALQRAQGEHQRGVALWEAGRHGEAIEALRRAVAMNPQLAGAWHGLGAALLLTGARNEGAEAMRQADVVAGGRSAAIARDFSVALLENGLLEEAEVVCRRAIALEPSNATGVRALAGMLTEQGEGRRAEAREAYARAIELKEASGESVPADWYFEQVSLGTTGASTEMQSAPAEFVRGLFDAYALKFEGHVVGELGYRVPGELARMVVAVKGVPAEGAKWEVLDLGCGTGLCGAAFLPFARRVVGVDLSAKMLGVARGRGIYAELLEGDVTGAMVELAERGERFDVVVAGDVLVYVGALEGAFAAAAKVLRSGGVMAFSLERQEMEGADMVLTRQRRYAHALAYVRRVADGAGFEDALVEEGHVRNDVGKGWWVVLRRG